MNKKKTMMITNTGVMAALCFVGTFIIRIPAYQGYIHLGDGFTLLSGIILGPVYGALAAGIGAMFADILSGYVQYSIASLLIKAVFALIAGYIYKNVKIKDVRIHTAICGLAGLTVPLGYMLFESAVLKIGKAAFLGVVPNTIQATAGVIVAIVIMQSIGDRLSVVMEISPKEESSLIKNNKESQKKKITNKNNKKKHNQSKKNVKKVNNCSCDGACKGHGACGKHCIKIKDLGVTIGSDTIIEHINMHIHCGKLTAVIGKNGAGKSTLVKAINGEIEHTGKVEMRVTENGKVSEINIGYVPQFLNIEKNTPTSVYDMFASYISDTPVFFRKNKEVYGIIEEQLKMFEAEELIDKAVCDLSGGELQRVMLSMATYPVPNLLLLDEPVSGIDKNGMDLFYNNICRLRDNYDLAIILISHDLEYVRKYADHVILLDKTIIKEGSPKEVFDSKEFREVFALDLGGIS
ncbi:MAG: ECF transporter S component [Lachnospiraceae bacterium]|nr:ECF transporter S component [Lachnospiraceae bacterium]